MSYTEPDPGKRVTAYLFVATMPYSQISYVEATASMGEKSWLSCHVDMPMKSLQMKQLKKAV